MEVGVEAVLHLQMQSFGEQEELVEETKGALEVVVVVGALLPRKMSN